MTRRTVYVTYALEIDLAEDAVENDIMSHPEVEAPPRAEIIDWGFDAPSSHR